jgi:hypothetical protein
MRTAKILYVVVALLVAACLWDAAEAAPVGPWRNMSGSFYDPTDVNETGGSITGLTTLGAGTATLTNATATTLTATTLNAPRYLSAQVEAHGTAATVGTRKVFVPIPDDLAGYLLADAGARVYTAGTTGTLGMSWVKRTTAGAEATAYTVAVTTGVVESSTGAGSTANRTLAAGDMLILDVTSIHSGTASKGLGVWLKLSK